jgi:hypothetical protein
VVDHLVGARLEEREVGFAVVERDDRQVRRLGAERDDALRASLDQATSARARWSALATPPGRPSMGRTSEKPAARASATTAARASSGSAMTATRGPTAYDPSASLLYARRAALRPIAGGSRQSARRRQRSSC